MNRLLAGLRLSVATLTVLPVPDGPVDRRAAGAAMALAPGVGVALGAGLGAVVLACTTVGAPAALTAVVTLAAGTLATRALHLDGLADTLDALGSRADPRRALEIMKRSDVGPFGVVGLVLALAGQGAAIAAIAHHPWYTVLAALALAVGTGRLAVTLACRPGVPAARPDGLGAAVAGTVHPALALPSTLALLALALPAVPGRPWQGPLAMLAGLAAAALLTAHVRRRLGGITGDVLGAAVEIATTVTIAILGC